MHTEHLYNTLLNVIDQDQPGEPNNAQQARAFTDILAAFAALLVPPTPEVQGVELVADDTPALILVELRKHNEHMANLMWHVGNGLLTSCR